MRLRLIGFLLVLLPFQSYGQELIHTELPEDERALPRFGVALEPMITYSQQDASIKSSQLPILSDDTSAASQSYGLALKIGGHVYKSVSLGVDGRWARNRITDSAYGTASGDQYNVGPTLGVQMPWWGARLWGTYVALGEFNPETGRQQVDLRFEDSTGFRVGVGFHYGPVSLNVEYEDLNFDNTIFESFGQISAATPSRVDFSSRGYIASLSFPLEM